MRGTNCFTTVKGLEGSCDLPRELHRHYRHLFTQHPDTHRSLGTLAPGTS